MPQLWRFKRTHLIRQERGHHSFRITSALTCTTIATQAKLEATALGKSLIHVVSSVVPQLESIVNMRTGPAFCTQHNAVLKPGTGFYSLVKMCKA